MKNYLLKIISPLLQIKNALIFIYNENKDISKINNNQAII